MNIVSYVVFMLNCVLETLLLLQRVLGSAFLLRFLEGLEKPWTVKR